MKHLQICALLLLAAGLTACENEGTTRGGNQEAKRRAAMAKEQQQIRGDQSDYNLQHAHENVLNRDSNPALKP